MRCPGVGARVRASVGMYPALRSSRMVPSVMEELPQFPLRLGSAIVMEESAAEVGELVNGSERWSLGGDRQGNKRAYSLFCYPLALI